MDLGAGRYAPSPTGDLHVGNLRTAVLALIAESLGLSAPRRLPDLLTSFDPDALPREPWVFPVNRTR